MGDIYIIIDLSNKNIKGIMMFLIKYGSERPDKGKYKADLMILFELLCRDLELKAIRRFE
jgi:hypothetical protein